MPYRRLPNTDRGRLRSLKAALSCCEGETYGQETVAFSTILEAKNATRMFEGYLLQYQQTLAKQTEEGKQYNQAMHNARMYISHFIKVFNMSVIRGEVKAECKQLYHLPTDLYAVPDLSTESAIILWGKRIIEGEEERIRGGGVRIYNPTINKVKVYYDLFAEQVTKRKLQQGIIARYRNELQEMRTKCDKLILSIWNQVEDKFKNDPDRLQRCRDYGVLYFYRKGEKRE